METWGSSLDMSSRTVALGQLLIQVTAAQIPLYKMG